MELQSCCVYTEDELSFCLTSKLLKMAEYDLNLYKRVQPLVLTGYQVARGLEAGTPLNIVKLGKMMKTR